MTHPYKAPKCFMAADFKQLDFMKIIRALTTAATFPFLQRILFLTSSTAYFKFDLM